MRLKTALISLILIVCPFALCYGQFSFATVSGKNGYSAMRGSYRWEEDNGLIWTPKFSYFRFFDNPDFDGSYFRAGLDLSYDLNDDWRVQADGFVQPRNQGEQAYGYKAGATWNPFYYWNGLKKPFIRGALFQVRHRIENHASQLPPGGEIFRETETGTEVEVGTDLFNWRFKAQWNKVLKYSNKQRPFVDSAWADVPYLTAVIQGFIREAYAARVRYRTDFIEPYASWVQYRFVESGDWSQALQTGLRLTLWETFLLGGVEIFEPTRDDRRKLFFMLSIEAEF